MMRELTNLLPLDRTRSLRQLYFLRLTVVSVLLLALVAIVHGVLLLPSYLYVREQVNEKKGELARLSASLAGSEEREVSARVALLADDSAYLARLATVPKASAVVSAIIDLPRPGITLSGFSFAPEHESARMAISGTAATREDLRRYEQLLATQPYVTSTDLPISAYAKESNIDFTITLKGTLMP